MIDDANWNTVNTAFAFEEAMDETLELESWMINENTWGNAGLTSIANEVETSLVLESWMIDENLWERESFINAETEVENELVLESWMINDKTWNIQ